MKTLFIIELKNKVVYFINEANAQAYCFDNDCTYKKTEVSVKSFEKLANKGFILDLNEPENTTPEPSPTNEQATEPENAQNSEIESLKSQFAEMQDFMQQLKHENEQLRKSKKFASADEMQNFLKEKGRKETLLNIYSTKLTELQNLELLDTEINELDEIQDIQIVLSWRKGGYSQKISTSNKDVIKTHVETWKNTLISTIDRTKVELKNFEL